MYYLYITVLVKVVFVRNGSLVDELFAEFKLLLSVAVFLKEIFAFALYIKSEYTYICTYLPRLSTS